MLLSGVMDCGGCGCFFVMSQTGAWDAPFWCHGLWWLWLFLCDVPNWCLGCSFLVSWIPRYWSWPSTADCIVVDKERPPHGRHKSSRIDAADRAPAPPPKKTAVAMTPKSGRQMSDPLHRLQRVVTLPTAKGRLPPRNQKTAAAPYLIESRSDLVATFSCFPMSFHGVVFSDQFYLCLAFF